MKPIDVLFLCETNAATSLMAEALVNGRGDARIQAYSAGRNPADRMVDEARRVLAKRGLPTDALAPKSWSLFALPGARRPDIVVDLAAGLYTPAALDTLQVGETVNWPLDDPSLLDTARRRLAAAEAVLQSLIARIDRDLLSRAESLLGRRPLPVLLHAV